VLPKKCGGTRLHRHREWSCRVERGGDVPQQAPPHPVRILTTDQVVGVLSLNADDDYRLANPRCSGRTPR
jgi:hypothetical protein